MNHKTLTFFSLFILGLSGTSIGKSNDSNMDLKFQIVEKAIRNNILVLGINISGKIDKTIEALRLDISCTNKLGDQLLKATVERQEIFVKSIPDTILFFQIPIKEPTKYKKFISTPFNSLQSKISIVTISLTEKEFKYCSDLIEILLKTNPEIRDRAKGKLFLKLESSPRIEEVTQNEDDEVWDYKVTKSKNYVFCLGEQISNAEQSFFAHYEYFEFSMEEKRLYKIKDDAKIEISFDKSLLNKIPINCN